MFLVAGDPAIHKGIPVWGGLNVIEFQSEYTVPTIMEHVLQISNSLAETHRREVQILNNQTCVYLIFDVFFNNSYQLPRSSLVSHLQKDHPQLKKSSSMDTSVVLEPRSLTWIFFFLGI